ncbi:MAG: DUF368 domain-containing protein [Coprobacillus sp.]|nr:DUF368 domain-containing protein [Coprobacillus sp.]
MKEKSKHFFRRLISGLLIGITDAIPGISGGTTAVIIRVYDDVVFAIGSVFKRFKESMVVIVPVILGMILGIVPCIFLFDLAFNWFAFGTVCIFAGLMVGTFPSIIEHVKGEQVKPPHIILLIVGIGVAIALGVLSVQFNLSDVMGDYFINRHWWFYFLVILIGLILAFFTVVPGISGSMILLVLGWYTNINSCFSTWSVEMFNGDFTNTGALVGMTLCLILGIIIGAYSASKTMAVLLSHWRVATYYLIIGFCAGSIPVMFYNSNVYEYYLMWAGGGEGCMSMWAEIGLGIGLFIVSIALGYLFIVLYHHSKKKDEAKLEEENSYTQSENSSAINENEENIPSEVNNRDP